jgi:Protein of unknown function (DUF2934)
MGRSYVRLEFLPTGTENSLANRPTFSNPIKAVKPISPVAKENNIVQNENEGPAAARIDKRSARAASSGWKNAQPARKKSPTAPKKRPSKRPAPERAAAPSDEEIRLRAYFISERRHRLALPGDTSSDWLEAKRQLLSETRSSLNQDD